MAKKVTGYIKLQIPAGKATPAPPVGPALGQHGVNIVQFTKEFNARTADKGDLIIPVVITVYQDMRIALCAGKTCSPLYPDLYRRARLSRRSNNNSRRAVKNCTAAVSSYTLIAERSRRSRRPRSGCCPKRGCRR